MFRGCFVVTRGCFVDFSWFISSRGASTQVLISSFQIQKEVSSPSFGFRSVTKYFFFLCLSCKQSFSDELLTLFFSKPAKLEIFSSTSKPIIHHFLPVPILWVNPSIFFEFSSKLACVKMGFLTLDFFLHFQMCTDGIVVDQGDLKKEEDQRTVTKFVSLLFAFCPWPWWDNQGCLAFSGVAASGC